MSSPTAGGTFGLDPGSFSSQALTMLHPFIYTYLKAMFTGAWGYCCEENSLSCPWGIYSLMENEHIKLITGGHDLV